MVNNGIYNKAIYWPKEVRKMVKRVLERECTIYPTQHMYDRLENYDLPMDIWHEFMDGEVIEAEVKDMVLTKIVTRTPSSRWAGETNCAAIVLEERHGRLTARITTVWINDSSDNHATVQRDRCVTTFVRAN